MPRRPSSTLRRNATIGSVENAVGLLQLLGADLVVGALSGITSSATKAVARRENLRRRATACRGFWPGRQRSSLVSVQVVSEQGVNEWASTGNQRMGDTRIR